MIRLQVLRLYRREYFHALRNGLEPPNAADQALTRVKRMFLEDQVVAGMTLLDRQEKWGEALEVLLEFQILLRDIPIDRDLIPAKPPIEVVSDKSLKDLEEQAGDRAATKREASNQERE